MMNQIDIAWVTGIIEGEGCIKIPKNAGRHYPTIKVRMTDKDIIYRLQTVTEVGNITEVKSKNPRHKDSWNWQVGKRQDVIRLLCAMAPLLGERRRAKALEAAIALQRNFRRQIIAQCGTRSGYNRHKRLNEDVCDSCREATRLANARRYSNSSVL